MCHSSSCQGFCLLTCGTADTSGTPPTAVVSFGISGPIRRAQLVHRVGVPLLSRLAGKTWYEWPPGKTREEPIEERVFNEHSRTMNESTTNEQRVQNDSGRNYRRVNNLPIGSPLRFWVSSARKNWGEL